MEGKAQRSRRPLIIATVFFVIIVIVVGAVVWKVTKDAYEGDSVKSVSVNDAGNDQDKSSGGNDDGGTDGGGEELTEEELERSPWKRLRLPRTILPVHYDIKMYPDFYEEHGEFYGNETILLQVTKPSKYLFIHVQTDYMNITEATVQDMATQETLDIKRTFVYKPNQFFVIEGKENFKDSINVHLQFEGSLTKGIVGIYKSAYVNSKTKQKRYLATSKFEPTFARRAFPCLDEPNMKANFTITLIHRHDYTALSNMDVDKTYNVTMRGQQLAATQFHQSVTMSTYLVCFIVCDFESISATSQKNTRIRVFATPDKQDQTQYALDMAKHTLDLYEKIFEIDYPLPKQDLIAIPDFVSGAMEHWGLITFRESALLYNSNGSTLSSKKRVATVVAHEMAHQWFGNLVTMDWWNDLWLNEGFASYIEYIGTADKEKDWDMDSQFIIDDMLPVMSLDDVINTHPIVVSVKDPSEITSVFDAISYSKGASVIRMLDGMMGSEKFFKGVASYLKKYMWRNAKTDDLWQSLTEVEPSIKVKEIMDTWTIQDGYPYVNISLTTTNAGKTTLHVSQHRFMSDPNAKFDSNNSPFGYKWYILLDYMSPSGSETIIMNKASDVTFEVPVDFSLDKSWIKFNKDKKGFYRVLYPDLLWERLSSYLMATKKTEYKLSSSDRADILGDAFQLASADLISYEVPLNLTKYLRTGEDHYVPWKAASDGLASISAMLKDDPEYEKWRGLEYDRDPNSATAWVLQPQVASSPISPCCRLRKLYALLYLTAADAGDKKVVEEINLKFRGWLDNGIKPPIDIRGVIYRYGMSLSGTEEDWNKVWGKYLSETSPSEKKLLLRALASTSKPNVIAKFLDHALRLDGIRRQDFFAAIQYVGFNGQARHLVWDWMQENYGKMEKMFTVMDRYFGRMAYYLVRQFKTPLRLKEVINLFKEHPNEGTSARYRKMALESINRNIQWLDRNRDAIMAWVGRNGSSKQ